MSQNEKELESILIQNGIEYISQKPIPFKCPWMTARSRSNPKVDFYLPSLDLYIEVKGFMTIEAMAKMAYISRQNIKYYIYQCTESDWNPLINNQYNKFDFDTITSISGRLKKTKIFK